MSRQRRYNGKVVIAGLICFAVDTKAERDFGIDLCNGLRVAENAENMIGDATSNESRLNFFMRTSGL